MCPDLPFPSQDGLLAPAFAPVPAATSAMLPRAAPPPAAQKAWLDADRQSDVRVQPISGAVTIAGGVDYARLAAAVALALDECPALRPERLAAPHEANLPDPTPPDHAPLALIDLTAEDDADAAARSWMQAELRRLSRLADLLPCRFALLRLSPDRHVWFMAFRQHAIDAVGRDLFTARVATIYADLGRGGQPASRPAPAPEDLRAAADAYLASPRAARDRAYWLARLRDPPEPLLAADPRLGGHSRAGPPVRIAVGLPPERADALRAAAARLGVTLPRLLTALAAIGFARWYERTDLLLAMTLHDRVGARRRRAIGPFSRTLPLRLAIDRGARLADAVGMVALQVQRDQRHRLFPVGELHAALGRSGQPRRFADVTLSYLPAARPVAFDGVAAQVEQLSAGSAGPWTVSWVDAGPGAELRASVDYDAGLIPRVEGEQVAEALRCLLEAAPDSLGVAVGALPLMLPATHADVLRWSSGETMPIPGDATLATLFAGQAGRTPHAPALVCNDERLDYATLHAQAAHLAARLAAAGIRRGSVVALALPRTPAQLVGVLAVHIAGAAYLPLDPAFPPERLAFMCGDSGAALVLTTAAQAATLPALPCPIARIDVEGDLPPPAAAVGCDAPMPDDLAYVLYTSGSTGRPKGVAVEHRSLVNFVFWVRSLVDSDDLSGVLFATMLGFDISVVEIFLPLSFGGKIVMVENLLVLPAAPARAEVRLINTVPSLLEAVLRVHGLPPGLRTMFLGGETLRRSLAERLLADAPRLKFANLYGPTEATVYAGAAWMRAGDSGSPPIGRPIWNSYLYVLDADGALAPPGAAGDLWIGGLPVARGYVERPELTAERFRPNPFGHGRIYRTGDRARWRPDGQLAFLGRLDDQIKLNGVRIEPGEIEAALRALPGVAAAAVALRADDPGAPDSGAPDSGAQGLLGWLVPAPGAAPRDSATLRADLRKHLPEIMVPASFVWVNALPLTANGKLDRNALRTPPQAQPRAETLAIPTPLEIAVAALLGQVLRKTGLLPEDDFFEVGGDSLAAVNLLSQVELRFGVRLTTDVLAQGLTVARLARLIDAEGPAELPGLVLALQPLGDGAPFYCVPGIGGDPTQLLALARRMGTERPFLALRGGLAATGTEPDRIEDIAARYVEALLARHPGGPILLGGYSLGAAIAFEMAQLLGKRGHGVALLALIDTRRPDWRLTAGNAPATLFQVLRNLPHWIADDLLPGGWGTFARNLRRHLRALSNPSAKLDRVLDSSRYSARQRETMERFDRALRSYRPAPYSGRLVVLRARAQPLLRWFDDHTLSWRGLAGQGVDLHRLPGNHATILGDPAVRHLADRLRACIALAEAPPGGPTAPRASPSTPADDRGPTEASGQLSPA